MVVIVLGATGYAGSLLVYFLSKHPEVEKIIPVSFSNSGKLIMDLLPNFKISSKDKFIGSRLLSSEEAQNQSAGVVFSALPNFFSSEAIEPFLSSATVIDLAADFRIKNHELFTLAYGESPPRPDLLPDAVYGLSEWHTDSIKKAQLIANPGCYPTATLLPLLPCAKYLAGNVVINAMSGITGAGRNVSEQYLFSERSESVKAYLPGREHRHYAEISAYLQEDIPNLKMIFNPHLVPMRRGIAVSIVGTLNQSITSKEICEVFNSAYGTSCFVKLCGKDIPSTADVWGSNRCDISWQIADDSLLLFSVIDNLVKGAAGQAIQNMNIRMEIDESEGLQIHGNL